VIEAWRFEIKTSPTNFLRRLIHLDKAMDEDRLIKFEHIYQKIKRQNIGLDFDREEKLEEKRDLRTNKYGGAKVLEKKTPRTLRRRVGHRAGSHVHHATRLNLSSLSRRSGSVRSQKDIGKIHMRSCSKKRTEMTKSRKSLFHTNHQPPPERNSQLKNLWLTN